jgi:dTDP-4-amino-4,6-dideoxygalactose transaminase
MLVLKALDVRRPLVPDFTFSATALAASWACGRFVTGDCDLRTFNLLPNVPLECDAVLSTHIFSNPSYCDELQEVSEQRSIPIIYDSAHAHGALYKGRSIGDIGRASVFSCSPTKSITTLEGGVIVTKDKELGDRLRCLRNYGTEPGYQCSIVGLNARMNEFSACIGLESLATFSKRWTHRMKLVDEYRKWFDEKQLQETNADSIHGWKDFSVLLGNRREQVRKALDERKIEHKSYFRPISALKAFEGQPHQRNAWNVSQSILQLPLHDRLNQDDVRRICKVVLGEMNGGPIALPSAFVEVEGK